MADRRARRRGARAAGSSRPPWRAALGVTLAAGLLVVVAGPAVAVVVTPPDRPVVSRIPCQSTSATSADGELTNATGAPVEVRFEGPSAVLLGGVVEAGADPLTVVAPEGPRTLTLLGVTAGDEVGMVVGGQVVDTFTVADCRARVEVATTVDADGDGRFASSERAVAPGLPVTVRADVTNTGVPAAITLTVTSGTGAVVVLGPGEPTPGAGCAPLEGDAGSGDAVAAGRLLDTGASVRCTVVLPSASPARGAAAEQSVTVTATPADAEPATARSSASVTTATDVDAGVGIAVATDADGDGTPGDAEFAPAPASDVPVTIEVTNTGPADGVPRVVLEIADGGAAVVVLDPYADGDGTCVGDDGPVVAGVVLPAGSTIVCSLVLVGASPETAAARVLTASVELLAVPGARTDPVVIAADRQSTRVLSTIVLDETVEGGDDDGAADDGAGGDAESTDGPAALADGGAASVAVATLGAALLVVGAALTTVVGRRGRPGRVGPP